MTKSRFGWSLAVAVILTLLIFAIPPEGRFRTVLSAAFQGFRGEKTIADRLTEFGPAVRSRMTARFQSAGVTYPPAKVILVGLKGEKVLEVWVSAGQGDFRFLWSYPILGASGGAGPKLAEGDGQVPEGFYRVESLNPNSAYHLALRLNYPNDFDRQMGQLEGRSRLGSDIMIHGKTLSAGCLAMGDQAVEELFVLIAETGITNVEVLISPVDFRLDRIPLSSAKTPKWTKELYSRIAQRLKELGAPL